MKFMFIKREPLSLADGISQFLFSVSDALIRLGHEVVCVTSVDKDLASVPQNYDFTHYPKLEALAENYTGNSRNLCVIRLWMKHAKGIVAKHNPDLIILNGALPVRFSCPTALVAHDLEARKIFGDTGRIVFKAVTYRLVNHLIVTCPELVEPVAKESLCNSNRFSVIPTCIDTSRYLPVPLNERRPVILHCGMQKYKMPMLSVEAFTAMQVKDAQLVIVGKIVPEVQAAVAKLPEPIRNRIQLPGIVSAEKLKELLTTSRVMSVPSLYTIPVASPTVLEAMASHTPSVLSPSISRIVIEDSKNCFVESTAVGMARRFDELLTNDETWLKISAGSGATKGKFDSLTIAKQYEELAKRKNR